MPTVPSVIATPTVAPLAAPTKRPIVPISLEDYWRRLAEYRVIWNLDQIRLLPAPYRDDPFFGINDALVDDDATAPLMRGQGATFDRVEVRWDLIEPQPYEWSFDALDRIVDDAQRWNVSILAVVDGTPAWAAGQPKAVGSGPPAGLYQAPYLSSGEVNRANPWTHFLATIARRYRGHIADWEIWNEPNFRDYWNGTADDYGRLFTASRLVLKREAPGTAVLLGGLVVDDGSFLRGALNRICPKQDCGGQGVDGVAWHIYGNPEDVVRVTNLTREITRPLGLSPAIWITEANVPSVDPAGPADATREADSVTLDQQAAFVIQLDALARSVGVKAVAIYRAVDVWENGHYWGLFRRGWSPKPALQAFHTAAQWLGGTNFVSTSYPFPDVSVLHFTRGNDDIYVVWSSSSLKRTVHLPVGSASATTIAADGQAQPTIVRNGQATISPPPATGEPRPSAPLATPIILDISRHA